MFPSRTENLYFFDQITLDCAFSKSGFPISAWFLRLHHKFSFPQKRPIKDSESTLHTALQLTIQKRSKTLV